MKFKDHNVLKINYKFVRKFKVSKSKSKEQCCSGCQRYICELIANMNTLVSSCHYNHLYNYILYNINKITKFFHQKLLL